VTSYWQSAAAQYTSIRGFPEFHSIFYGQKIVKIVEGISGIFMVR